ncbi:MAG: DUF1836 domain-containing protein [Lachnospiraceae bacterium]
MTIDTDDLLNSMLESLSRISYIKPEDIPNIDLYMDQVTTFMNSRLKESTRNPDEDKILTKTMINNYAKNNIIPPPIKKKYSKEHMLMLIFVYYFKGVISFHDIEKLLSPISEKYFDSEKEFNIEDIYKEVFELEYGQAKSMQEDILKKFNLAQETFEDASENEAQYLKTFSFICLLSFDVYVKRLLIEKIIDGFSEDSEGKDKKE